MRKYYSLLFFAVIIGVIISIIIPVQAYNSAIQPIYQPNLPPSSMLSIHDIGNVTSTGCALGQVLAVDGAAIWSCLTLSSTGEINTASNVGVGHGLFKQKTLFNLEFLNIFCAGNLICSSNSTDVKISYVTPPNSIVAREESVGRWIIESTLTGIGMFYSDVYTTPNSNGKGVRIDTSGKTTVTMDIMWTKIGVGTQKCRVVDIADSNNILIVNTNLINGENINATQNIPSGLLNTIKTYKPQCLSSVGTDSPIWISGQVLLR